MRGPCRASPRLGARCIAARRPAACCWPGLGLETLVTGAWPSPSPPRSQHWGAPARHPGRQPPSQTSRTLHVHTHAPTHAPARAHRAARASCSRGPAPCARRFCLRARWRGAVAPRPRAPELSARSCRARQAAPAIAVPAPRRRAARHDGAGGESRRACRAAGSTHRRRARRRAARRAAAAAPRARARGAAPRSGPAQGARFKCPLLYLRCYGLARRKPWVCSQKANHTPPGPVLAGAPASPRHTRSRPGAEPRPPRAPNCTPHRNAARPQPFERPAASQAHLDTPLASSRRPPRANARALACAQARLPASRPPFLAGRPTPRRGARAPPSPPIDSVTTGATVATTQVLRREGPSRIEKGAQTRA